MRVKMARLWKFLTMLIVLSIFIVAYVLPDGTAELIGLIVAVILGLLGMKPIDWLKTKLGIADVWAVLLVYTIATAVGALALWATGELAGLEWTLNNLVAIAGVFIAAAKLAYEAMKSRQ